MNPWHIFVEIPRRPLRASVTICAVALGVFTLASSMSIVRGVVAGLTEYIESTGGYGLVRIYAHELVQADARLQHHSRPLGDVEAAALKNAFSLSGFLVAPEVGFPRSQMTSNASSVDTYVVGAGENYMAVNNYAIREGRSILPGDEIARARVIVLSPEANAALFPNGGSIGSEVRFGGATFLVVGVLKEYKFYSGPVGKGTSFKNRLSIIPLSTARERFLGGQEALTGIHLRVSPDKVKTTHTFIDALLPFLRDGYRDIDVETREREIAGWHRVERSTRAVLGILSALILAVSGAGIANTVMASVQERVREVGIRKATGATSLEVAIQFVFEGTALSAIGGLAGVLMAWLCVPILRHYLPADFPGEPIFEVGSAFIGLFCSIFIGCLASIIPALRAGRMSPYYALRT